MSFLVKDSGKRQDYASGLTRDTQEDKPDYTLIPRFLFPRWAKHMALGMVKYGRENWKLAGGNPDSAQEELDRFKSSFIRHAFQYLDGDTDEDHASAVLFNLSVAEYIADRIKKDDYNEDALYEQAKALINSSWEPAPYTPESLNTVGIGKEGYLRDTEPRVVTTEKVRDYELKDHYARQWDEGLELAAKHGDKLYEKIVLGGRNGLCCGDCERCPHER